MFPVLPGVNVLHRLATSCDLGSARDVGGVERLVGQLGRRGWGGGTREAGLGGCGCSGGTGEVGWGGVAGLGRCGLSK